MMKPQTYPLLHPVAHRNDPASSYRAGEAVHKSGRAFSQKLVVLAALRSHGPCSSKSLAEKTGLDRYMIARRLPELFQEHKVNRRIDGDSDVVWEANV